MVPNNESGEMKAVPNGLPRVSEPADENDVLREQLDYLIDHVAERGLCGCTECQRYVHVRSLLLEIFGEPQPAQQIRVVSPTLAVAA
jgi:hypothetical protein